MLFSELDFSLFRDVPSNLPGREAPHISVSEKGMVNMNDPLREKIGDQRTFRMQITPDGAWLALWSEQPPNVCFSQKAARMSLRPLAQELRAHGFSFPVLYVLEWDEQRRVWVGPCQEMGPPPSLGSLKRGKKQTEGGKRS